MLPVNGGCVDADSQSSRLGAALTDPWMSTDHKGFDQRWCLVISSPAVYGDTPSIIVIHL